MDANGARHLCEADDRGLKLSWIAVHDIREFVDNDNDIGKRLRHVLSSFFLRWLEDGRVIGVDIAHMLCFEDIVASLHLLCRPLEREDRFLWVGNHWRKKVRNAVIGSELDAFRVDHDKAQLIWTVSIEKRSDNCVDGDRLSRPCCASDKAVRHLRDIHVVRRAGDVAAECSEKRLVAIAPLWSTKKSAEADHCFDRVWHLDSDERLSWDRCLDAHRMCSERELKIVCERDDL